MDHNIAHQATPSTAYLRSDEPTTTMWNLLKELANEIEFTSSTAQGGGGSFKNRKPIGEIGCCESRMAEQKH